MAPEIPTFEELEQEARGAADAGTPGAVEIFLETERARFKEKFTYDGLNVATADTERQFDDAMRVRYDSELASRVLRTDATITATLAEIDARLAESRRPPKERDPLLHELRVLNLRQHFEGRTLRDVVIDYLRTDDNPTLIQMVEQHRDSLRLKADPNSDIEADRMLKTAIAERQAAREPKGLREQRDKIAGLRTASFQALVQYAGARQLHAATARRPDLRGKIVVTR